MSDATPAKRLSVVHRGMPQATAEARICTSPQIQTEVSTSTSSMVSRLVEGTLAGGNIQIGHGASQGDHPVFHFAAMDILFDDPLDQFGCIG
jgi:hypothetical protein